MAYKLNRRLLLTILDEPTVRALEVMLSRVGSTEVDTLIRDSANTPNTIVLRDGSGNFAAGTITAALTGNASTATKWATSRTITYTGDATGSFSLDGSADASTGLTLANVVAPSTATLITYNAKGLVTAGAQAAASDLSNGVTGSGAIVLATNPSLNAPDIGAATGTSVSLTAASTINANSAAAPTAIAGTLLQVVGADSSNTEILMDTFAAAPVIIGRRANNTNASPSALANGQNIFQLAGRGYGATAYSGSVVAISMQSAGAYSDTSQPTQIIFQVTASGSTSASTALTIASDKSLTGTGAIKSSSATGGIGYATGAGGTVTQTTSKSTGVTLNTVCGDITMNNAALAAATIVSFVLTNSAIAATDLVVAMHVSGGTLGSYGLTAAAASGSATIYVRNNTAGSLSEAIVIKFAVIKTVTS